MRLISFLPVIVIFLLSCSGTKETEGDKSAIEKQQQISSHNITALADKSSLGENVLWRASTRATIGVQPQIYKNSLITGGAYGYLSSIDLHTGTEDWSFNIVGDLYGSNTITDNILITSSYMGKSAIFLYAFDLEKKQINWRKQITFDEPYDSVNKRYPSPKLPDLAWNPIVYKDVVFAGGDLFYAFDKKTGELIWECKREKPVRCTPALYDDNVIFGNIAGEIYSVHYKTGKINWKYEAKAHFKSGISTFGERTILGTERDTIYCLNSSTGKVMWKTYVRGLFMAKPVRVGENLLISNVANKLCNLNLLTGEMQWEFPTKGWVYAAPTVKGNSVFVGDKAGMVYKVDLETGTELWRYKAKGSISKQILIYEDDLIIPANPYIERTVVKTEDTSIHK